MTSRSATRSVEESDKDQKDTFFQAKEKELSNKRVAKMLNCGFVSGLVQAFCFNPWDRALYLSVKHERAFLHKLNFAHPMAGVSQTVFQRAISAGLYFPLEEIFVSLITMTYKTNADDNRKNALIAFVGGILAGSMNGLIMNPFTRVKYQYWGKTECSSTNFLAVSKEIYKKGGIGHFFVGATATVKRDLVFGGFYALLRREILPMFTNKKDSQTWSFVYNLVSAVVATVASSPLNYVRNIHYATPPDITPKKSIIILKELYENAKLESTSWKQWKYVQVRLRLGWGTARVGCGMGFGAVIYDTCSKQTT